MLTTSRLFRTIKFTIVSAICVIACPFAQAAPPDSETVQLDGWLRPTDVWRTYSGVCGGDRYEISIWLGRPLSQAIRDIRLNSQSYVSNWRSGTVDSFEGSPVDAVVNKCTATGAEIRFDVSRRSDRRTLHFYYISLSRNGDVSMVGEK